MRQTKCIQQSKIGQGSEKYIFAPALTFDRIKNGNPQVIAKYVAIGIGQVGGSLNKTKWTWDQLGIFYLATLSGALLGQKEF